MERGSLYHGEVIHARLRPVAHKLRYRVFSMMMDVDRLEEEAARLRLFSLERFNLFSLYSRQHGHRDKNGDGRALSKFAWGQVAKLGLTQEVERITMLFYPRLLGFAFNPLTVYFCLDHDGAPRAMIYEVRNTFGEDVTYVLKAGAPRGRAWTHGIDKSFYVSPFNVVEGDYTFHVTRPDEDMTVGVALKTE
ncbi:MAG: DUF1365 domain-containing protein, partial [Pseudomonadota bacterium]